MHEEYFIATLFRLFFSYKLTPLFRLFISFHSFLFFLDTQLLQITFYFAFLCSTCGHKQFQAARQTNAYLHRFAARLAYVKQPSIWAANVCVRVFVWLGVVLVIRKHEKSIVVHAGNRFVWQLQGDENAQRLLIMSESDYYAYFWVHMYEIFTYIYLNIHIYFSLNIFFIFFYYFK